MKVSFYHRHTVNALLLAISFSLPLARLCLRLPIHVGSLEGFILSPQTANAVPLTISFPLPTCATVKELVCAVLWFLTFVFSLYITLSQAAIFSYFHKFVYDLPASSACTQALIVVHCRQSVCGMCAGSTCYSYI